MQAALEALGVQGLSKEALSEALAISGLQLRAADTPAHQVTHPQTVCCECLGELHLQPSGACSARVLDVDGWKDIQHVPRRCRRRPELCRLSGKRIWCNFLAVDKNNHKWLWPHGRELEFLYSDWGVACRWFRQQT
jgi:hypothetical protein